MARKSHFRFLGVASALLSALILTNCGGNNKNDQSPSEFKVKKLDTTTAVVNIDFSAVIQSKEVIQIRSKVTGYLDKVLVAEGGVIRKGQSLFKINDADFVQQVNAAKAATELAESNVSIAQLEIEKLDPLVKKGIISPYELQTARDRKDAATAQLQQAKAQLENARINLGYTNITSPVDGILGRITVREGSLIAAGNDELTTVSGFGDIWAYFSFDEKKVASILTKKVESGKQEQLSNEDRNAQLIMSDGTIYSHKGMLETASGIIDRATGSIQLKVVFPNPDMQILSGSSGVVRFPNTYHGCILVPQSATFEMQDKIMAYTVGADNTVEGVSLTIIGVSSNNDYVVENLTPGTVLVTEGADKLKEGQKITPKFE
ncbi:efflux RND transporter periplasmic adaptor subunit [Porphyromonadaceae bacterium]